MPRILSGRQRISMFFPVILVCVSILIPVGPTQEGPVGAAPFSTNDVVKQVPHRRERTGVGGPILGHWEDPATALLEEFMIDTSITYGVAGSWQGVASIASDGTNYLVVWQDARNGVFSDVFGTRVSKSGTVIDSSSIAICTVDRSQGWPSVAFDGTNYLVVWHDWRIGVRYDLYATRVDTSGAVLDSSGVPISAASGWQHTPSVAFGGANYLVVWEDSRGGDGFDIYCARVDTSVVVLDSSGVPICTAVDDQRDPSVAFDGTNFLVVWEDRRDGFDYEIFGARIDTSGTVLDSSAIRICAAFDDQWNPSVAFDGTNYLVIWQDGRSGVDPHIWGARVDTSGTVLDFMTISAAPDGQGCPSLAFDGDNYLAVWQNYRSGTDYEIYGARIDTSGAVLDSSGICIRSGAFMPALPCVTFGDSTYMVVWNEWGIGTDDDIYGARLARSGEVLDSTGVAISTGANWQGSPSLAFGGAQYFVAWEDNRRDTLDIYGARISETGIVLDPSGIAICSTSGQQASPSSGSDGTEYIVVWEDLRSGVSRDIYGARVSASGAVLDPSGIPISTAPGNQASPCVAYDGSNYLAIWEDLRGGPIQQIYGTRITTSGAVLDTSGIPLWTIPLPQETPNAVFGSGGYLVVWALSHSGDDSDIYGTRVDTAGRILDSSYIAVSIAMDRQEAPSAAFGAGKYLVVWKDYRSGFSYDIYGARVSESGIVLDPSGIPIATGIYLDESPSVAFDGIDYVVVWEDQRNGSRDVYGARVDTSGVTLDPSGVELINALWPRTKPVIASGSGNQLLLACEGFAPKPYNSQRIFGAFYTGVGIEEKTRKSKAATAKLLQNRPNPFHTQTTIQYQIPVVSFVSLKIYDPSGRLVSVLVDEQRAAGSHIATWDGRDTSGLQVSSGIYFCLLEAGGFTSVSKMIFLR